MRQPHVAQARDAGEAQEPVCRRWRVHETQHAISDAGGEPLDDAHATAVTSA